jgi:hypothetical protein
LQFNQNGEAIWLAHFAKIDGTYKDRQVLRLKTKKKNITRI